MGLNPLGFTCTSKLNFFEQRIRQFYISAFLSCKHGAQIWGHLKVVARKCLTVVASIHVTSQLAK